MAESVTESVRGYVSCIKINGKPILPPLMTEERRAEMRLYKDRALSVEAALNRKRHSVDSGVICPSSRSSSWGKRKSVDTSETATPRNARPSVSEEEALLFELMETYASPTAVNNTKKLDGAVSNNASKPHVVENVCTSHITGATSSPVDVNACEVHQVTVRANKASTGPADVSEIFSSSKDSISEVTPSHSEYINTLHQSSNVQEQKLQSVLPSTSLNFGTSSPVHGTVLQSTSPIPESATQYSSQSADEANIPVKKIHASLNISEIVAQDDIIQDGLGFKVWKHGCEALRRRPQHSSTPAETTQESLSTTENNRIENLDESVSSVVVTASTDLNNYMNVSGSSKSSASIQSLSSIAPVVLESEIVRQTTDDSSSDNCKQTETHTASESQLQKLADDLGIDGIRPLVLETETTQSTTIGAETKAETMKTVAEGSTESNDSRTSSDSPLPRLKRQHSYVLESPSPLLVEHLKAHKYDGDMTGSPTKKMLSSSENHQETQKRKLLKNSECITSLPTSSVSSPIKLESPFASSECLSSNATKEKNRTNSVEGIKTMTRKSYSSAKENLRKPRVIFSESPRRFSAEEAYLHGRKSAQKTLSVPSPRSNSVDNLSPAASRKPSGIAIKSPKTPHKTLRTSTSKQYLPPKNTVQRSPCVSRSHSTERTMQAPTPERLSAQEDLRELFLQLQIEHQQQMAELVEKQKREQEAMREAFQQQQNQLMNEIRSLCPEVFSTPESHKLLEKSFTQPLGVGMKEIKNDNTVPEKMSGSLQENVAQKQANVRNDDFSSRSHLDDASSSGFQMSTSVSEVAETSSASGVCPSEEAHQNQPISCLTSEHVVLSNTNSSASTNNASQHTRDISVQDVSDVHNSTSTSDIEASAKENTNFSSEISSKKSDFSTSMINDSSASVEYSDSILTSGASGSNMTQQMLYSVHTNGAVINEIHNVDVAEVTPSLSENTDHVMLARASDLDGNTAALYGLTTDGKIVSSMLTVAKSEVILSDGLPYLEPREETVRTTVFTQLNGVDHNGLVNAHFSTVMHGARQSCSRQLFPVHSRFGVNYTRVHEIAAARIQAGIRGYLTRRLFRTARVQDLITTIRDTLLCAVQLSQECWPDVRPEDVALHGRLIQQVTAACYALHDVFFSLPVYEQMAIIAADRERQRSHAPRSSLPRPLSAATRRALERKARLSEHEGSVTTGRSRRTWSACDNPSGSYGIARSCLLRQQQMSPPQQLIVRSRRSTSSSGRRPWR